jgi:hypothetical protein
MLSVKRQTFAGTPCKVIDKNHGPHAFNHLQYYRMLKDQLEEYPFGPSSLYSSSCIQTFSFKAERPNNQYLIHGDSSGTLKINQLIYNEGPNNENTVYNLNLDRSKEVRVCDEKLKKYSRIFGVVTSELQNVVGIKYWEGVAIANLELVGEGDDERIKTEIISRKDLTGKCCCDLGFVDNLDSYLVIDSSGSLTMTDLTTSRCVKRWEDVFSKQVSVQ